MSRIWPPFERSREMWSFHPLHPVENVFWTGLIIIGSGWSWLANVEWRLGMFSVRTLFCHWRLLLTLHCVPHSYVKSSWLGWWAWWSRYIPSMEEGCWGWWEESGEGRRLWRRGQTLRWQCQAPEGGQRKIGCRYIFGVNSLTSPLWSGNQVTGMRRVGSMMMLTAPAPSCKEKHLILFEDDLIPLHRRSRLLAPQSWGWSGWGLERGWRRRSQATNSLALYRRRSWSTSRLETVEDTI